MSSKNRSVMGPWTHLFCTGWGAGVPDQHFMSADSAIEASGCADCVPPSFCARSSV